MSIYVKLEEDSDVPNDDFKGSEKKTSKRKVIPPAPPIHFPKDDSLHYMSDALFTDSQEYTRPIHCEIIGEIPSWIRGTFIRVGPGRFHWGDMKIGHLFDGDAIAHRFTVEDGKVTYQSKFLKTEYHRKNEKYNTISSPGFGTWAPPDPCANIFRRIAMYFIPSFENDNTNVNVFNVQGKTYVATETPWMVEIDKGTLDTIKRFNARDNLSPATASWLAHPHFEPDGTTWFISTKRFPSQRYEIIRIPPTPGPRPLEGIEIFTTLYPGAGELGAGYYHSFCVTENYVILVTNPLYIDGLCGILTMNFTHNNIANLLKYHPEVGPRFRIVDKKTKKELRECRADPMFFFHSANSYETEDEIVIDLVTYTDDKIIKFLYMKNCWDFFKGETITPPNLARYRIPKHEVLKSDAEPFRFAKIPEEGRDNEILFGSIELPIYNYDKVNGRDYNYCYGQSGVFKDATLCKVNVKTKEVIHWYPPKNVMPSNPFFVQRPGGTKEDDGVIVANCTGMNDDESFFLVLDATNMKEIARANMWVGFGAMIHGTFFPEK